MSSTLYIRKTPKPEPEGWHFKQPVKQYFGERFFGHDGSLGGDGVVTIGAEHLGWLEGVVAAGRFDDRERRELNEIIEVLRDGDTVDIWFEA